MVQAVKVRNRPTNTLTDAIADMNVLGPALLFGLSITFESRVLLVAGLAWAACEAIFLLLSKLVLKLDRFSFVAMTGAATSATFLGGALPIQIEILLAGHAVTAPSDARYIFNTDTTLTASVALYLTAFRYVCGIFSCWDTPHWQRALGELSTKLSRSSNRELAVTLSIVVAAAVLIAGLLSTGLIAVNTAHVGTGENAEMPIWLSLLFTSLPTLAMASAIVVASARGQLLSQAIAISAIAIVLVFAFAFGRRTFLFTFLLVIAVWFWLRPDTLKPHFIFIAAISSGPLLLVASTIFQAARLAQGDISIVVDSPSLHEVLLSDAFQARLPFAAEQAWSDFASRAYSISFFVDVFERFTPQQAMMGELFAFSGPLRAIPSLFWPEKTRVLADYASPELPVQRMLMLYETDQAMPMAVIGYVDWWIFGAIIAPAIVLAISMAFVTLALWSHHVIAKTAAISSAIVMAWNAEFEFAAAFVYLRFVVIAHLTFAILDAVALKRTIARASHSPSRS